VDLSKLLTPGWYPQKPVICKQTPGSKKATDKYYRTNASLEMLETMQRLDFYQPESNHSASYYRKLGMAAAALRKTLTKLRLMP
jgi:hypothetical protein